MNFLSNASSFDHPSFSSAVVEAYRVVARTEIRNAPDRDKSTCTGQYLRMGQFISITHRINSAGGFIFLRLEDESGYIEASKDSIKALPISTGVYVYEVTNSAGLAVRSFPDCDKRYRLPYFIDKGSYIASNMRVRGARGEWYPRIEGVGWLFETRDKSTTLIRKPVQVGTFVYMVQNGKHGLDARVHPDYRKDLKIIPKTAYSSGMIVSASFRVQGQFGDWFVRLDAGGWLFESRLGQQTLVQCPVESGNFIYSVLNKPMGLALRTYPDYRPSLRVSPQVLFTPGKIVTGTERVQGEFGDVFVKMKDFPGWLFETRLGSQMLAPVARGASANTFARVRSPVKAAQGPQRELSFPSEYYNIKRTLRLYFAGVCVNGKKGPCGSAAYCKSTSIGEEGKLIFESMVKLDGNFTRNIAEYSALILALQQLEKYVTEEDCSAEVEIVGDSELVVSQMKRMNQVSNGVLSRYYRDASSTLQRLKKSLSTTSVKFKAIPTVLNGTATKLAKKALQLNAKKIVREPTEEVLSKIILGGSTFVVRSKHGNSA